MAIRNKGWGTVRWGSEMGKGRAGSALYFKGPEETPKTDTWLGTSRVLLSLSFYPVQRVTAIYERVLMCSSGKSPLSLPGC